MRFSQECNLHIKSYRNRAISCSYQINLSN